MITIHKLNVHVLCFYAFIHYPNGHERAGVEIKFSVLTACDVPYGATRPSVPVCRPSARIPACPYAGIPAWYTVRTVTVL